MSSPRETHLEVYYNKQGFNQVQAESKSVTSQRLSWEDYVSFKVEPQSNHVLNVSPEWDMELGELSDEHKDAILSALVIHEGEQIERNKKNKAAVLANFNGYLLEANPSKNGSYQLWAIENLNEPERLILKCYAGSFDSQGKFIVSQEIEYDVQKIRQEKIASNKLEAEGKIRELAVEESKQETGGAVVVMEIPAEPKLIPRLKEPAQVAKVQDAAALIHRLRCFQNGKSYPAFNNHLSILKDDRDDLSEAQAKREKAEPAREATKQEADLKKRLQAILDGIYDLENDLKDRNSKERNLPTDLLRAALSKLLKEAALENGVVFYASKEDREKNNDDEQRRAIIQDLGNQMGILNSEFETTVKSQEGDKVTVINLRLLNKEFNNRCQKAHQDAVKLSSVSALGKNLVEFLKLLPKGDANVNCSEGDLKKLDSLWVAMDDEYEALEQKFQEQKGRGSSVKVDVKLKKDKKEQADFARSVVGDLLELHEERSAILQSEGVVLPLPENFSKKIEKEFRFGQKFIEELAALAATNRDKFQEESQKRRDFSEKYNRKKMTSTGAMIELLNDLLKDKNLILSETLKTKLNAVVRNIDELQASLSFSEVEGKFIFSPEKYEESLKKLMEENIKEAGFEADLTALEKTMIELKEEKEEEKEYAKIAGVKFHLNPGWDKILSAYTAIQKKVLLEKVCYLAALENEKKLSRRGGRVTSIYISQITPNFGEEKGFQVWMAGLDGSKPNITKFNVTESEILNVPINPDRGLMLDPNRATGRFLLEYPHKEEKKQENPAFISLDMDAQALIQHEQEERAAEELEVRYSEELSNAVVDRRNQLKELERAYKQAEYSEAQVCESDELDEELTQEAIKLFDKDPGIIDLRAQLASIKAKIAPYIENGLKMIAEQEEMLRAKVSQESSFIRQETKGKGSLYIADLVTPLIMTVKDFIPQFLEKIKKMQLSKARKFTLGSKKDEDSKLKQQQKEVFDNFVRDYKDIIPSLDPEILKNLDRLGAEDFKKEANRICGQIQEFNDKDKLVGIINAILSKASTSSLPFISAEREVFANSLRDNINALKTKDSFFELIPYMGKSKLVLDSAKAGATLKKERSSIIQQARNKLTKEIIEAKTNDPIVMTKLELYQEKIAQLEERFKEQVKKMLEAKKRADLEQKRDFFVKLNELTEPPLEEVAKTIKGYLDYLKGYLKFNPKDNKETRNAKLLAAQAAAVNKPEKLQKLQAVGQLLDTLEKLYELASGSNSDSNKKQPEEKMSLVDELNKNKSLLKEKLSIVDNVEKAFSSARTRLGGTVIGEGDASSTPLIKRGMLGQGIKKITKAGSPKILINKFYDKDIESLREKAEFLTAIIGPALSEIRKEDSRFFSQRTTKTSPATSPAALEEKMAKKHG